MKNFILILIFIFTTISYSQDTGRFGLTAGYLNLNVKASYEGMDASVTESGFVVGGQFDIPLSNDFYLQPGVTYGNAGDSGILFIPVVAKMYIANSGFNLQAGPQASLILNEVRYNTNVLGIDLTFGAAYDISNNFFLQSRYAHELTNRITGGVSGVRSTINSLTLGLGYKF